ncbi:MAG: HAMP domain-containing histidine kinase [Hyphomicrobiaceae bacterium]|nr:HAMP domain-containing histidine kinase [Hyphomicrobiaceae bacterium]
MLNGTFGKPKSNSLMGEYSTLLGDAVLRYRTRVAEHTARLESELANRVKSEFISNMSHELRTPLNTVIGFSKILAGHDRRRLPDEEIVEYAQLINDSAVHLLSVINDILDISKIQSGKYTIDARETPIDEIIQVCVTSLRKVAFDAGVTIDNLLPQYLPPVRGDAAKLRQAMSNILSNAVKFTPKGGRIVIEGAATKDGGLVVSIADSGVGMTEDEIMIALTPFGQVDGTRARWREGAGLGLPIAQALIDLHGGRIAIKSKKGEGTIVSIMLPSRHEVSAATGRDMVFGHATPE